MKVVLSPNPYRDRGLKIALKARDILEKNGATCAMCLPFAVDGNSRIELPTEVVCGDMETELKDADVLVCFGGDGTILHAARNANGREIPVLGVNMGSVGFMAELEHSELHKLSQIAQGKFSIETRMMMDVTVYRNREIICKDIALNDAVITKGAVARVIDLTVEGDRTHIYDFSGDGVVLATPTGSTAYSMSAGGPIVEPESQNLLVTPICAHSLNTKPLVMSKNRVISVRIARNSRKTAYLSVDGGRALKLGAGDYVEVRRSRKVTKLARLTKTSFYETIDKKLGGG